MEQEYYVTFFPSSACCLQEVSFIEVLWLRVVINWPKTLYLVSISIIPMYYIILLYQYIYYTNVINACVLIKMAAHLIARHFETKWTVPSLGSHVRGRPINTSGSGSPFHPQSIGNARPYHPKELRDSLSKSGPLDFATKYSFSFFFFVGGEALLDIY